MIHKRIKPSFISSTQNLKDHLLLKQLAITSIVLLVKYYHRFSYFCKIIQHNCLRFVRDFARKKWRLRRSKNASSSFITNNPKPTSFRFFRESRLGSKHATGQRYNHRNPDSARCNEYAVPFSKHKTNAGCSSTTASGTGFRSFRGVAHPSIYVHFPPRKTGMTRSLWILEPNQPITLLLVSQRTHN